MLALVALDYFVLYLHRNLINYFQPPLEADLDIGKFELGLLRWGFILPYCLAQLVVGYLGDRYRRRTVLLASLSGSFVCLGLMALVHVVFRQFAVIRKALRLPSCPGPKISQWCLPSPAIAMIPPAFILAQSNQGSDKLGQAG